MRSAEDMVFVSNTVDQTVAHIADLLTQTPFNRLEALDQHKAVLNANCKYLILEKEKEENNWASDKDWTSVDSAIADVNSYISEN